jgi:hypothetical protein
VARDVESFLRSREPAGRDRTTEGTSLVLRAFKVTLKDNYKETPSLREVVSEDQTRGSFNLKDRAVNNAGSREALTAGFLD